MLSDKIIEKLVERLVQRIEKLNLYALKEIAKIIKELRTLRPSDTHKLIQIMQYGGDYRKIVKKLAEINKTNEEEIKEIFEEVSKKDYQFAEQFYKYRKKNYIPWEENKALREQTEAIARITANEYNNLSKTLAFARTVDGKIEYTELSQVYQNIIDEGITSVSQGRSSFNTTFRKTIRELSKSGLKSVDWESGVVRRLDTAVRMNLRGGLMHLHEENEKIIGKQIGADGVEITVHENPAPDHEEAQGKQFTNEEFDKLQSDGRAKDVDGEEINLHRFRIRTKDFAESFRPIGEYNCYHRTFSIVLGVNKPLYDKERLKEIRKQNKDGFEYEGDHYTMYQGTQLQRKIETAIRREKDTQIMAKESGDEDLAIESQTKINTLLNKYVELSEKSGLPTKMERIRVDGYRPIKIDDLQNNLYSFDIFREKLNKNKLLMNLADEFDLEGFYTEYDKFYNSINEKELVKLKNDYLKWHELKPEQRGGQPIGQFLNKKLNYDIKPELITKEEFWKDEKGNKIREGNNSVLDKNHLYRGICMPIENQPDDNLIDIEKTKKIVEEFKTGEYYAGIGINGNGTYATTSYDYAERYSRWTDEGIIYIIPKDNIKVIQADKISWLSQLIGTNFEWYGKDKDETYKIITNAILSDPGYLASLLGYDMIDITDTKIILNRGAIKVVR